MLKAWSLDWLKTLSFGGMARGGGGGTFYVHLAVRGQILFFARLKTAHFLTSKSLFDAVHVSSCFSPWTNCCNLSTPSHWHPLFRFPTKNRLRFKNPKNPTNEPPKPIDLNPALTSPPKTLPPRKATKENAIVCWQWPKLASVTGTGALHSSTLKKRRPWFEKSSPPPVKTSLLCCWVQKRRYKS